MTAAEWALALSVFLACTVEAVEALTIVLAVGLSRDWASALAGTAAAVAALAAIVGALGQAVSGMPIGTLRLVVGGLLLIFGMQWLTKAILRSAGLKAIHDEELIFRRASGAASAAGPASDGLDRYAFAVAFKGVLLEGLEVVFIVLSFGGTQQRVGVAAAAAGVAVAVVVGAGVVARGPLGRVPENTMKLAVGVMLTSFGMFWGAEGAGASWPGGDGSLVVIVPALALVSLALAKALRRRHSVPETERQAVGLL